jgi:carbon monoxide dehydrogenase subunit G
VASIAAYFVRGPYRDDVRPPVIDYRRGFQFAVTPEQLWERIEEVDQFERWWPWLSECELEGNGLTRGSVLQGVVSPPLPYRMRIRVELGECVRQQSIQATVGGDLTGVACLTLRPEGSGTWAEVAWTIEMQQPAMRLASRFGYPLLRWGHDRVVEMTVAGFRRRIEP